MKQFVCFFLTIFSLSAFCQSSEVVTDSSIASRHSSAVAKKDKVVIDTSYINHRANRAALYSAILPGLGQAYNKKYWKLPIIYGGFAVLAVAIDFNHQLYKDFKKAYQYRTDDDPYTVDEYADKYLDPNYLVVQENYYRRTRDLMYIFAGALYVINIIDAYVDAHLANFDVSDDLTLHTSPSFQFVQNQPVASLSVSLSFR